MATKFSGSKKKRSLRNTVSLLLVLLLIAGINYFMGDPLGMFPEEAPANKPIFTAAGETTRPPAISSGFASQEGTLEAYILDVGQGDSIFLRSPSGKTMLVDASTSSAFDHIDAFLQEQSVEKLDVVIATHPHADHIGGMTKVIEQYEIGTFYMTDAQTNTAGFEKMLTALQKKNITVKQAVAGKNSFVTWDDAVEVAILSPFSEFTYDDLNNSSIICRIKFGDTAIMLTGDAEAYAEKIALGELSRDYFKADVLKLGHHGSSSSTCAAFLEAVDPDIAIASLGADNDYGHPHEETLAALKEAGIPLYRTDESGDIHVLLDGSKVSVETTK